MNSQMSKLYANVVKDFINMVEKQYKNKGIFSNQQIDFIQSGLLKKLSNTQNFQTNLINQFYNKQYSYLNQSKQEKTFNDSQQSKKMQTIAPIQSALQNSHKPIDQQDEDDDLNHFKKNQNKNFAEKTQIKQINDQIKESNFDFDLDESDDERLNSNELSKIKQKTGIHILGSYSIKDKNFNVKKEQTRIIIQNALIKIQGHETEILFPRVELVTKRVSKNSIDI